VENAVSNETSFLGSRQKKSILDVIPSDGEDRPSFLVLDRECQVIAIEIGSGGENDLVVSKRLNNKIATLKETFEELKILNVVRVLVCENQNEEMKRLGKATIAVSSSLFQSGKWIEFLNEIDSSNANESVLEDLSKRLHPAMNFVFGVRGGAKDDGKEERKRYRITLDEVQSALVTRTIKDTLVITGPPGSGKTLLLIARAKWLATIHPKWTIKIIAYNNLLVSHLSELVRDFPNVEVLTFRDFARKRGDSINEKDETRALADVNRAKRTGILKDIDAIMIDEAQDFFPAWIRYCLETVMPNKGGIVLVGDEQQSIYRDGSFSGAFLGHEVEITQLEKPYRCTKQIMHFAEVLSSFKEDTRGELSPSGPLVDVVFSDTWEESAQAVAWEISNMVLSGERHPSSIAVLCTQYRNMFGRVGRLLESAGVRYTQVGRPPYAQEIDPGTVTISTIHSAKGYEFDVVFLIGVDNLPYSRSESEEEIEAQRHLAYVGATRAKDQLFVMYSKSGELIMNLSECDPDTWRSWIYPTDYPLS
jgi:thymidine kinase